ncbi:MAG: MMPL family transporter [Candidatus Nanopelagicales bacterium]|nr:MMPL family transporter [Candidatus Nanopelagicales bacterium]
MSKSKGKQTTPAGNTTKSSRRALWLAVGAAVMWLMVGSWAGPLAGSLSDVQENDNATFLPSSAESTIVSEEQEFFATNSAIPILAVITHPDRSPLTAADQGAITEFLAGVPQLILADGSRVGQYLESEQLFPLPSEDGKALLVNISVNSERGVERIEDGEFAFAEITNEIRDYAVQFDTLQINVTGPGGFLADLIKVFGAIDGALLLATAVVVAIILIFVYRSPVLWLIPLISAGFALAVASGIVYVLADSGVLVLNGQSQGILTVLVFGAGTDYSLLLVSRYREELHKYLIHTDAIGAAIRGVRAPIMASSATTSIGLMCLLLSELNSNKSTGPVSAVGVIAAMLIMLTFLPALLTFPSFTLPILAFLVPAVVGFLIGLFTNAPFAPFAIVGGVAALTTVIMWIVFGVIRVYSESGGPFSRERFPAGRWAFWPKVPQLGEPDSKLTGVWSKLSGLVGRKPRVTWVSTALVLLVFAGFSTTLNANGVATSESFTNGEEVDSVIGQNVLVDHFPGGLGSETIVTANQGSSDQVLSKIAATPGVADTVPYVNPSTGDPTTVDGRVLFSVTLQSPSDSAQAEVVIGNLRTSFESIPDAQARVGGPTAVAFDINEANLRDRKVIIPTVLIVILIILIILLRAFNAPIVLVGTVLLSYFATLGACALAFNYIFDFPGADPSFPLFAFVFLVALGVDYNIFLLTRVREETVLLGTRQGILKGLTVTGGVITSAGIVLAATFLVLAVLPLVSLRQIGFAVALGVLIDAFIVRTTLVPALAYDIGKKVWWPSSLSKKDVFN